MTKPIQLTDAAFYYKKEPQQKSAWEWLQLQQTPEVMAEFAERYRDTPEPPKPQVPQPGYITPELMQAITGHPAGSFDAASAMTSTTCWSQLALTSTWRPCRC